MLVVLDTDVVLAGLRSPTGASRILLRAVRAKVLEIAVSVALVLEYEAVLTRDEHRSAIGLTGGEILQFLDALVLLARPVWPEFSWRPVLSDPGDELVFECAVNAGVDALVTFNLRHYAPAKDRFGLVVERPGDFLRRLSWLP